MAANVPMAQPAESRGRRRPGRLQDPPEHGPDLRHSGRGHGQPHGPGRRHARVGHARPALQPAVHLRRGGPGQNPPGARRRQQAAGRPPGAKVLYIHAEQFVSDVVKAYQRKTFDEFKDALPLPRPAADRRRPVLRQQGPHAGGVLQRLRGPAGQEEPHRDDLGHLSRRAWRTSTSAWCRASTPA